MLAAEIRSIVGVVEHGLFLGMATLALVAGEDGVTEYCGLSRQTCIVGLSTCGVCIAVWLRRQITMAIQQTAGGKVWFITGASTGFGRLLAEERVEAAGGKRDRHGPQGGADCRPRAAAIPRPARIFALDVTEAGAD